MSLFDMIQSNVNKKRGDEYALPDVEEFNERDRLFMEKEVLGLYVSGHPLSEYTKEISLNASITTEEINEASEDPEKALKMDNKKRKARGNDCRQNREDYKKQQHDWHLRRWRICTPLLKS